MTYFIKLPENLTNEQIETCNKNYELFQLAMANKNRYGTLISLCSDLGSQDAIFWDVDRMINVYPYSPIWYNLAYGYNRPDSIIYSSS